MTDRIHNGSVLRTCLHWATISILLEETQKFVNLLLDDENETCDDVDYLNLQVLSRKLAQLTQSAQSQSVSYDKKGQGIA